MQDWKIISFINRLVKSARLFIFEVFLRVKSFLKSVLELSKLLWVWNMAYFLSNFWLIFLGSNFLSCLRHLLFADKLWIKLFPFQIYFFLTNIKVLIKFWPFLLSKELAILIKQWMFLGLSNFLFHSFPYLLHPSVEFYIPLSANSSRSVRLL